MTKYKMLTAETVYVNRVGNIPRMETMYRIQALKDIPRHGVKSGQIGGYVSSSGILSHQGDCWIGEDAKAYGNVQVLDNALLTNSTRVITRNGISKKIIISGDVKIRENAYVGLDALPGSVNSSLISGYVDISGFAIVQSPCVIEGRVRIYGSAQFEMNCSILNNARVGGNVKVGNGTVITENSHLYGDATVGDNCEVTGDSILSGDIRINSGRKVRSLIEPLHPDEEDLDYEDESASVTVGGIKMAKFTTALPVSESIYHELFAELKEKFDSYHNDVINLLRYPVMSDMTNDFTRSMVTSMRRAERALKMDDELEIKETVLQFEECLIAAESNARKIASTVFSPEEKKKTEMAMQLFNKATDEGSPEPEKKTSLRRAFKELEGVMDVPESAKAAIVAKAGLLELEA